LPKYSVLGQLQYMLDDNWGAHFGFRHTEYDAAVTNLGILTLEYYQGNYRAAYTLYSGHLADTGSTTSQRLQLSRYYADKSWLGLAFSGGSELENIGGGVVQQSDVQSLILNGRHWFSLNWALSYEAIMHRQGDYYTRNGVRFGLRRQF
jgi:YaiO family outer membrane protein